MGLILKITGGPLDGQTFPVNDEMIIGRQGATINLNDPKVSSQHARISNAGGSWQVLDNNSKNGLRDAQGERIDSAELKAGVTFHIGESAFEVIELSEPKADPNADPGFVPVKKKAKKNPPRPWNEILTEFVDANTAKFSDREKVLLPLDPGLILEFVRGVQVNAKWILGFGPRQIGPACLDLPIWEPGAPEICFEIHPTDKGLLFRTHHPKLVQLNGQEIDNKVLRMGDTIQINETLIEVDFVE